MIDLSIGLSGLKVAQRAMETIGNNVANASTPGFHRQELRISSVPSSYTDNDVGGGSEITEVIRQIDRLLELEFIRQQPQSGQVNQELQTLKTIEGALGEITGNALNTAISSLFSSMRELAGQPDSQALQEQTLWAADSLASALGNLASSLTSLGRHILDQADEQIAQANELSKQIALNNREIQAVVASGGNASVLRDQRDQAIVELGKLVDIRVETPDESSGRVNVLSWGTPLVIGAVATELDVRQIAENEIGVGVANSNYYLSGLSGGTVGGLMSIRNGVLPAIHEQLDTLAAQIIQQVNKLHVQGIGSAGSFTSASGVPVSNGPLAEWNAPLTAGDFCLRLIDPSGQAQIHHVSVEPATDSLQDVVDRLNAIDPALSAEVADSRLHIHSTGGWEFDFLPALTLDQGDLALPGRPEATLSGHYTGQASDTFTATVVGSGMVGNAADLALEVHNSAGELVARLSVGQGYAAGEDLAVTQGIKLAIGSGTLTAGESFQIEAPADTDSAGFLAAAGINTFFSGSGANDIAVRRELFETPGRIATALGADGGDNLNISRMGDLVDCRLDELEGSTVSEYFRRTIISVGENIRVLEARKASVDGVMAQLSNQRDSVSGVDINEEAARLLVFERMYQGMAKFLQTQNETLGMLMDLV
jgi:flagellar hook-associated protein FlgK